MLTMFTTMFKDRICALWRFRGILLKCSLSCQKIRFFDTFKLDDDISYILDISLLIVCSEVGWAMY